VVRRTDGHKFLGSGGTADQKKERQKKTVKIVRKPGGVPQKSILGKTRVGASKGKL